MYIGPGLSFTIPVWCMQLTLGNLGPLATRSETDSEDDCSHV
jgi:hypothetical protein